MDKLGLFVKGRQGSSSRPGSYTGTGGSSTIGTVTPPAGYIQPGNAATTIAKVFDILTLVAVILTVGFIIYGGIKYVMSEGDATKIKEAQSTITYAILGLVIAIAGRLVVSLAFNKLTGNNVPDLPSL